MNKAFFPRNNIFKKENRCFFAHLLDCFWNIFCMHKKMPFLKSNQMKRDENVSTYPLLKMVWKVGKKLTPKITASKKIFCKTMTVEQCKKQFVLVNISWSYFIETCKNLLSCILLILTRLYAVYNEHLLKKIVEIKRISFD